MKLGIDRFQTAYSIGLLSAVSACDSNGLPSFIKLFQTTNLRKLFSAEHGFAGHAGAGDSVADGIEPRTELPIYSLYQAHSKELNSALLEDIDALVYDIQDVGARFYTYTSSLLACLKACRTAGKAFIVLDRPNPIGNRLEGFGRRAEFSSFVGAFDAPIRYGLTCGELARYLNKDIGAELEVVSMEGYQSHFLWKDCNLSWTKPSPNIIDAEACLIYIATCYMEGLNVSEGRGTDKPFYQIGAPFIDPDTLIKAIGEQPGISILPVEFTPVSSKYAGEPCRGIEFVIEDTSFAAFPLGMRLVYALQALYSHKLEYLQSKSGYFLDLLCGNDFVRRGLPIERVLDIAAQDCKDFSTIQKEVSLYGC